MTFKEAKKLLDAGYKIKHPSGRGYFQKVGESLIATLFYNQIGWISTSLQDWLNEIPSDDQDGFEIEDRTDLEIERQWKEK